MPPLIGPGIRLEPGKTWKPGWLRQQAVLRAVLWLAVGPFGNVRGDPLQNEFPDQVPRRALANARQTIEND